MELVTLDWSTAEVKKSNLTVALDGEIPKGWRKSFATTVRLLGAGEWGEVQVKKNMVQVSDVEPGTEDKLRHHLDAVVAQANANHEPYESEDDEAPDAEQSGPGATDDQGLDAEMTQRFRSF